MSTNLVDSIKALFTGEFITRASQHLGENENGVHQSVNAIVPILLGGLLDKSSTPQGANTLSQWTQNQATSGGFNNPLSFFDNREAGNTVGDDSILQKLFGPKASAITDSLANYAAVKPTSARNLIGLIGPAILGFIGSYAASNNLKPAGIATMLNDQKENIRQSLPAGLNLGAVMAEPVAHHDAPVTHHAHHASPASAHHHETVVEETGSGLGWGIVILLLALLGAGAWYMSHDSNHDAGAEHGMATTAHDGTAHDASAHEPAAAATGAHHVDSFAARESLRVKLANGTEIDAYRGGIEEKLVMFLNTDYKALSEDSLKSIWFDFDNLNFNTASAELTPESQKQVANMTAILKAYPKATLKIGGYTDRVGDEAANKKLSNARANAVKAALATAGVGAQITGAEGYGSSFAKYPATASEADRVKDRRVSVSVR